MGQGDTGRRAAATEHPSASRSRRGAVVAALMLSMALAAPHPPSSPRPHPQIVGDLGGFSVFSWLFSGSSARGDLPAGVPEAVRDLGPQAGPRRGRRRLPPRSLLCATAMAALIAFRIVQGLGGGALQGTVQTLAADLYPLERPKIQAELSTAWVTSGHRGPLLGGFSPRTPTGAGSLINLPIGALALWLIVRHLHEPVRESAVAPGSTGRARWPSSPAAALLTALVQGGVAWDGPSAPVARPVRYGTCADWCRGPDRTPGGRTHHPRLGVAAPHDRGRQPGARRTGVAHVAPTVFLPTYAQAVLGLAPVAAGFALSVWTLSWPVSAAFSHNAARRHRFATPRRWHLGTATLILLAFPFLPYPGEPQPALLMLLLAAPWASSNSP